MRHLGPDELIDLAEGTRPEADAPHLLVCDGCRRQLIDARAMLSAAAVVDVPEPSPLFWDHLSARVRQSVVEEAPPRGALWLEPLVEVVGVAQQPLDAFLEKPLLLGQIKIHVSVSPKIRAGDAIAPAVAR